MSFIYKQPPTLTQILEDRAYIQSWFSESLFHSWMASVTWARLLPLALSYSSYHSRHRSYHLHSCPFALAGLLDAQAWTCLLAFLPGHHSTAAWNNSSPPFLDESCLRLAGTVSVLSPSSRKASATFLELFFHFLGKGWNPICLEITWHAECWIVRASLSNTILSP